MTWLLSAISLAVATVTGGLMFRRNARKVDADTTLATTAAAAAAVDMMRDLMAEQRIEIDGAKRKAEAARLEAAEAKMYTQACEARERGLRAEMALMRHRLDALEAAAEDP
jgi:aspartokinase-like uncharacterized kinase